MTRVLLSLTMSCAVLAGGILMRPFDLELRTIAALMRYLSDRDAPARARWGVALVNLGFWGFFLIQVIW